jgi:hypothetical protein
LGWIVNLDEVGSANTQGIHRCHQLAAASWLRHTQRVAGMKIIIIVAVVLIVLFALMGRASRRGDTTHPREGADGGADKTDSHDQSGDSGGDGSGD